MKKCLLSLILLLAVTSTQAATKYEINVGGIEVTSDNKNNVTGGDIDLSSGGKVTYDPDSKILTLTNVSITRKGSGNYAVHNRDCTGLTIKLVGNNTLVSNNSHGLKLQKNTTINVYSGTTNVNSLGGNAASLDGVTVTVNGSGNINFTASSSGSEAMKGNSSTVVNFYGAHVTFTSGTNNYVLNTLKTYFYNGSDVRVKGHTSGTKKMINNCTMSFNGQTALLEPYGASYSSQTVYTSEGSAVTTDDVYISNNYVAIINSDYFPDEYFQRSLLKDFPKGYINSSDVAATATLNIRFKNTSSLKGIEYFSNLKTLNCDAVTLTGRLDLSKLTMLKNLNCAYNQLTSLSMPSSLESLICNDNKFLSLTVKNLSSLKTLKCNNNPYLSELDCSSNALTELDVRECSRLEYLFCSGNQLTSIVGLPSSLKYLSCGHNQFTSLPTLPSGLESLLCGNNKFSVLAVRGLSSLQSLDLTGNSQLKVLDCSNNALTRLLLSGCTALTSIDISGNKFTTPPELPESLQEIFCTNTLFTSLSGFSNRSALKKLDCSNNQKLTSLYCTNSSLTSLNVTGCPVLVELNCTQNKLTSLNLTGCNSLVSLSCGSNEFTTLSITGWSSLKTLNCRNNLKLTTLYCCNNYLTSLAVDGCSALTYLDCADNKLTTLSSLPSSLQTINCANNQFTTLEITGRSALKTLYCVNNSLLTTLNCSNNALTTLNVSNCKALQTLNCNGNQLTSLDVSNFTKLTDLQCYRNNLNTLNVYACIALKTLNAFSNNLTELDLQTCVSLNWLNIRANQIKESAMGSLINLMRSIPTSEQEGTFYVYGENYSGDKPEGNVITAGQIKAARAKRWIPSHKVGSNWVELTGGVRGDLNNDGIVDVSDVNIMIDMVLGKQPKDVTIADLDGNNMIDVTDVGLIIDIVLGKN